jgi:hypothetical protein
MHFWREENSEGRFTFTISPSVANAPAAVTTKARTPFVKIRDCAVGEAD